MANKTWILLDQTDSSTSVQELPPCIKTTTLQHGVSQGVHSIQLNNGKLAFQVLPTRGMSIRKAFWKGESGVEEIGWNSPVRGPVHPQFVPLAEPSGLGWLDGFDELLVRCGLESNGAPEFDKETGRLQFPLHGRIGNTPARRVELTIDEDTDEISLTGWVDEIRFHFLKVTLKTTLRTKRNSTEFEIIDEVTNLSASEAEIQMLYHINFGLPLLDAGSQILAPVSTLVPRNAHAANGIASWNSFAAETPDFEEEVYFASLQADTDGKTMTMLKNAHGTKGIALRFNVQQLPCFTIWKNTTAAEDGYVTGFEPGTNFPNPRSFEASNARVVPLAPHGSAQFRIQFEYCANEASVAAAETQVSQLQTFDPTIHSSPLDDWCSP